MTEDGNGQKEIKREGIAWLIAGIFFVVGISVVFLLLSPKQKSAPKVVFLGDSIYATARGGDAVPDQLAGRFDGEVLNAAFGGTSLARTDRERWMDLSMDSMSFISLSKSILSKDFSVQRQARIEEPATEYFDEVIEELSKVDFSKVEILFLGYGMNDYQNAVSRNNPEDPLDEYSFGGALRRTLGDLQKKYPSLRMILLTPTYSWYLTKEKDCEQQDWGGGFLWQYVALEKEIAAEYGVAVIDLYQDLYEHEVFEDWKTYTVDGVHPNDLGRKLIAERIAAYLEEHP